jgi:hypothetical protein
MRLATIILAAAAALTAGAAEAASVEVRDAVVRVTVVPEARNDIQVQVLNPNDRLPISVRTEGARTIVDGGLRRRIRSCNGGRDGRGHVRVSGVGKVGWDEAPHLVIHTPRAVVLSANGAVRGEIGRSGGIDLDNSGCSHWTIADVAGDVSIEESGAGSIRMGSADRLKVSLSGASNIHATTLRQGMDAELSGAGGVNIDQFSGVLTAEVSGFGRVKVAAGRASMVRADVSGVGGVDFGGSTDGLDASISGVGNVRVKTVTGSVRKSVSGLGHVTVDNRP